MNHYFSLAAALTLFIGLAHSVIGERVIFQRLRAGGIVPTHGGQLLREAQVRILWASWHALTLFGWSVAIVLAWLAQPSPPREALTPVVAGIAAAMLATSVLVLVGTKGRHPAWIALLVVAALVSLGHWA